jgi:hypothetical protein
MHYGSDGSVWTNHDYVWPQRNKLSGYARQPFHPPFGKSVLECDVLALQISEPPQALDEGLVQMPNSISSRCRENSNPIDPARLLRSHRQWPRRRAADKRDELAPFQSIGLHDAAPSQ